MSKDEMICDVNTSKIKEGMIAKNYRHMCELLNEERKTGNARKAQMANWERYFSFTKIKGTQKIHIDVIYTAPLEKIDGRSRGNRSVYVDSVEVVLLNYLSHQRGYTATFTKNKLYARLGMVNNRYSITTNSQLKKDNPLLTDFDINRFRTRAGGRLNSILMSALNNLEKRFLIDLVEQVVLVDGNNHYMLADDVMIRNITSIKYEVKKEMGFETEQEIYLSGKMQSFYKAVNYYLDKHYGYKRAYTQFKIIFNHSHVCEEMQRLTPKVINHLREIEKLGDEEIRQELITMNSLVVDAFYKSAEKDYTNTTQKGNFQLAYNYVEKQNYLTDALIKIKNDKLDICEDDMRDIDEIFSGIWAN